MFIQLTTNSITLECLIIVRDLNYLVDKWFTLVFFIRKIFRGKWASKTPEPEENFNKIFRAIFCKNQTALNSDLLKNPSFLHILFLVWSIWNSQFFFKFSWLILKLWLIKVWGYFHQKLIFGWKSNFDTTYFQKPE